MGAELGRRLGNGQCPGPRVVFSERWFGKGRDYRLAESGDHPFRRARRSKEAKPVVRNDIRKPLLNGGGNVGSSTGSLRAIYRKGRDRAGLYVR